MSKPFLLNDDYIVIVQGKWYHFPSDNEAWEFYNEHMVND